MADANESGSRGALLIADDEEFVRHGLSELLRRDGFACVVVSSGAEGLEKLATHEFDALITDIHMPGNARLEMIEEVRQRVPALPVVVLTGKPSVETAARSVRLPVTAYLTKPPNVSELVSILDAAVVDYRGYRALQAGRARLHAWEKELETIERTLRATSGAAEAGGPMGQYLRTTLRQVILMLSDLEHATAALERGDARVASVDHEAALRRTVDVLERTKQNFKSRELAELRKQIEQLLGASAGVETKTAR
jgi:CheY-like chemotaxis protein